MTDPDVERQLAELKQELDDAREFAITNTFGGPNMYALLRTRNPELDLVLNAGILAGIRQCAQMKIGDAWQEAAWAYFRQGE